MSTSLEGRIARRLKALRELEGLTQEALASKLGLNHRQTLASIEAGERSVSSQELAQAAKVLGVDVSTFTDPFRLIGEGRFSFRADDVPSEVIDEFQTRAGQWIATYRELLDRAGVPRSRLGYKLELSPQSSYEEAHQAAEDLRLEWRMGDVPAEVLVNVIERELEARVLFIDAPKGVSGAAIHLPGLHTILVNRHESLGRRHFDIAHELFHLLTWDAMAPQRVEPRQLLPRKGNRVEKLADNFAGALLMPAEVVASRWADRGASDEVSWLNSVATSLRVTAVALKWRLVGLGLLTKAQAQSISDARLAVNGGEEPSDPPLPFDRELTERIHGAIEDGELSLYKALKILGLRLEDFAELCSAYGLTLSYEV